MEQIIVNMTLVIGIVVYWSYGYGICSLYGLYSSDNHLVYDSRCDFSRFVSSFCSNVRMGKSGGIVEKILCSE